MHSKRATNTIPLGKTPREIRLNLVVLNEFGEENNKVNCGAIFDTGATITALTPKIIEKLKLEQIGAVSVGGVNAEARSSNKYLATVILPGGVKIDTELVEAEITGVDALIGMDIISQLDFCLTHDKNGEITVSYVYPPTGRSIDYKASKR